MMIECVKIVIAQKASVAVTSVLLNHTISEYQFSFCNPYQSLIETKSEQTMTKNVKKII